MSKTREIFDKIKVAERTRIVPKPRSATAYLKHSQNDFTDDCVNFRGDGMQTLSRLFEQTMLRSFE